MSDKSIENAKDNAWTAGYVACWEGKSKLSIPYAYGDSHLLRESWLNGWNHFDAEYNPSYYSTSAMSERGIY